MRKLILAVVCLLGLAICRTSANESVDSCPAGREDCGASSGSSLMQKTMMTAEKHSNKDKDKDMTEDDTSDVGINEAQESNVEVPDKTPEDAHALPKSSHDPVEDLESSIPDDDDDDEPKVLDELREIFDQFDEDGSGELELEELLQGFLRKTDQANENEHSDESKTAGMREQLRTLINPNDIDGKETMNFDEFVAQQLKVARQDRQDSLSAGNVSVHDMDEFLKEMDEEEDHLLLDDANTSLAQQVTHHESEARRRKNKKQKKWAAEEMLKQEETICSRDYYHLGLGKYRDFRSMDWSWDKGLHCSGWDQVGLICYKKCVDQFGSSHPHGVAERCYPGCKSGYINSRIGECAERCGDGQSLPHAPVECHGWMYCADSWGTCNSKAMDIVFSFAAVAANLVPVGKAAMKAARVASGEARKALLKAALRAVAKKMLKKAKRNLVKYMKKRAKELAQEQVDAIMEGGAEMLATGALQKQNPDIAAEVLAVADAVDPTGVSSVIAAFHSKSCSAIKVTEMPTDGLEAEARGWSACSWNNRGTNRAANWACTPRRHYSDGTGSYEECQQQCVDDYADSCRAIEWRQGHECRTFNCAGVTDYHYGAPWEVGYASGCPKEEVISQECRWADHGPNVAAKWACTPNRHTSAGTTSFEECKDQCVSDYGSSCGSVEWKQDVECRTFKCQVTAYHYSGSWRVGIGSNCPSAVKENSANGRRRRRSARRRRR